MADCDLFLVMDIIWKISLVRNHTYILEEKFFLSILIYVTKLALENSLLHYSNFLQTRFLMNILIDLNNLDRTAFDENDGPKYRTHRNREALPGLAEFQKQFFTEKEDGPSENSSVFGVCTL